MAVSALTLGRRRRWTPSAGARVDRDHYLAAGLRRVWLFGEGGTPRDLIAGDLWQNDRNAADTLNVATPYGAGFQRGATGGVNTFRSTLTSGLQTNDPISVLVTYAGFGSNPSLESGPNAEIGATLFATRSSGNGPSLFYGGANGFHFAADGAGLLKGAKSGTSRTLGQWYMVGGTWDPVLNSFSVYVDGQLAGRDNYNVAGSFTGNWGDEVIRAQQGSNNNTADKRLGFLYFWRRTLREQDFAALYDDPSQIFETSTRRIFAFGPSSGTTQALAGTIGATSTLSGTLSLTTALSGTIAASSSLSGAVALTTGLSGTIAATSSLSGSLRMTYALSGTIGGTSSISGALSVAGAVTDDPNKLTMTIRETGKTLTIRERA